MSDVDDDVTGDATARTSPALTIRTGGETYVVEPADGPITIGRRFPAQVLLDDARISRTHLRLEMHAGKWIAIDHSRNGVYLDGRSVPSVTVTDGLTLHLGHPEGIPVEFSSPATPKGRVGDDSNTETRGESVEWEEITGESDFFDPGVARAGAAVAARRRELNISQRTLARDKIINAGALIAFEKGRSWPRPRTLQTLEGLLGWEPGEIARIRWQSTESADGTERTVVMGDTLQASFMVQALEIARDAIAGQIEALPAPPDKEFSTRAGAVLAELRRLEVAAANAARTTKGAPEVAVVLSSVRRQYRELMLRAATTPGATLGQRVFAARHRAALTAEEAANAASVSVDVLQAAEAESAVGDESARALEGLVASLRLA